MLTAVVEQLQKMNILRSEQAASSKDPSSKKTKPLDASALKPLKSNKGTVGFTGYRDANAPGSAFNNGIKKGEDDADSEDEDLDLSRKRKSTGPDKDETEEVNGEQAEVLSADDVSKSGELVDSVKKMQLKRQHSSEALESASANISTAQANGSAHEADNDREPTHTPPPTAHPDSQASAKSNPLSRLGEPSASVGSPFKKQRASLEDESRSPTSLSAIAAPIEAHSPASTTGAAPLKATEDASANGRSTGEDHAAQMQGSDVMFRVQGAMHEE